MRARSCQVKHPWLKNGNSVTIHVKNIFSSLKLNKVKSFFSIFYFQENQNYNLRSDIHLASRNMRTTLFWKETVSNLGGKTWPLLQEELKNASSFQVFQNKFIEWKPTNCQFSLCNTYIQHVAFI